jgi:hypothetical protein
MPGFDLPYGKSASVEWPAPIAKPISRSESDEYRFRLRSSSYGSTHPAGYRDRHCVEAIVGLPVHPLRFRANLYVSGWPPWHECELLGQTLAIGDARLKVVKRITRCAAINVDPETAVRDLDIPPTLMRRLGHNECGIYAEVTAGGTIGVGDAVAPEAPGLV